MPGMERVSRAPWHLLLQVSSLGPQAASLCLHQPHPSCVYSLSSAATLSLLSSGPFPLLFSYPGMLSPCVLSLLQSYFFCQLPGLVILSKPVSNTISYEKMHQPPAGHCRSFPRPHSRLSLKTHLAYLRVLCGCVVCLDYTGSSFGKGLCLIHLCSLSAGPPCKWTLSDE